MKFGIKNLMAVLSLGFVGMKAYEDVMEDGKINFWDLDDLAPVARAVADAKDSFQHVKDELLDLDDQEQVEIEEFIDNFYEGLTSPQKKELIDDTVTVAIDLFQVTMKWVNFRKPTA